ncbi:MAG: ion transporter [Ignavibacteriaceae bacterium]|nr:ion transporter [Ignavibacteriaceae bacterium]
MKIKYRIWEFLENIHPEDKKVRIERYFILILIVLNVMAAILGTVKSIEIKYEVFLYNFEVFSIAVFTVEYILRLWSCTSDIRYSNPLSGRLKYLVTPLAIVDLIAILPFYLPILLLDLRFIRIIRLIRIFRIAKAARYISSLKLFGRVFKEKKEELLITSFITSILIIISSSLMYVFENHAQPDKFADIPSTMWWAVATLTTIGYGDVFPITFEGKLLAAIVSILGIGLFALPTGILGAGFVEEFHKSHSKQEKKTCPHCGRDI